MIVSFSFPARFQFGQGVRGRLQITLGCENTLKKWKEWEDFWKNDYNFRFNIEINVEPMIFIRVISSDLYHLRSVCDECSSLWLAVLSQSRGSSSAIDGRYWDPVFPLTVWFPWLFRAEREVNCFDPVCSHLALSLRWFKPTCIKWVFHKPRKHAP